MSFEEDGLKTMPQPTDSDTPASAKAISPPLFPVSGKLSDWENDPLACFEGWLAMNGMSLESAKVYRFMWGKFARWMHDHDLGFARIRSSHIEQFLDDAGLTKQHRYRYVRLIERIYQHLALENPSLGNPGSQAARQRIGEGTNAPTAYLEETKRDAVIQWIGRDLSGETYDRKDAAWKEKRDLAIAAVMLGGGVKVGEARGLSVSCISSDSASIDILVENGPGHTTCLLPFARGVLKQWLEQRARMRFPGNWLFVAGADGRQMDTATLYRRVQRVMERAGVDLDSREGPQTLRNSFVAMLFAQDVPDAVVGDYLGLREAASVDRLRSRLADARNSV